MPQHPPNPDHELRTDRIAHTLHPAHTFPILSAPGTRITTSTSTAYLALAALPLLLLGHHDMALFMLLLPLALGLLAVSLVLPGLLLGARLERIHFSAFGFRIWANGDRFSPTQANGLIVAGLITGYALQAIFFLTAAQIGHLGLAATAVFVTAHYVLYVVPRLWPWAREQDAFHVDTRTATAFRGVFG